MREICTSDAKDTDAPLVHTPPSLIARCSLKYYTGVTHFYTISPMQSSINFAVAKNCFYSHFHLSAENMPSRFFRRRRRRRRRHAPKSFPNNLERCGAVHQWKRTTETRTTVFSLFRGHFHCNIVPHFPSDPSLFTRVLLGVMYI